VTLTSRPTAEERATNSQPATNGIKLGILGMTVDETIIKEMNLKTDQKGVLVEEVQSDSLADTAGLRASSKSVTINGQNVKIGGDIITTVDGQPVASMEELKTALAKLTSNQELSITLGRAGKEIQIAIQPGQ
jgi:serine protease Do